MKKTAKILTGVVLVLFVIGLTFVITFTTMSRYVYGGLLTSGDGSSGINKKTAELYSYLDQYYIGDDLDQQKISDAACAAMVEAVGDEWSYYISAEDYSDYLDQLSNAYVGVGITIQQVDENTKQYAVISVSEGSPAQAAGVLPGDIISQVDGASVADMDITEIKNLVKGEAGTEVTLDFVRQGTTVQFTMERKSITTKIIHAALLDSGDGYIKIDNFDSGCADNTIAAIEELRAKGAKSIIFDVRYNPGGLKDEVIKLLDYLLPEGEIFHTVDYAGKEEISTSDSSFLDMPMAVLVNVDSYSAAEYFAAALQEYEAATIVGTQTYGKGYFQTALRMSDGSAVNLSIGKYFTPAGKSLKGVGITPDSVVELDEEKSKELFYGKLEKTEDDQLQEAIMRLNS